MNTFTVVALLCPFLTAASCSTTGTCSTGLDETSLLQVKQTVEERSEKENGDDSSLGASLGLHDEDLAFLAPPQRGMKEEMPLGPADLTADPFGDMPHMAHRPAMMPSGMDARSNMEDMGTQTEQLSPEERQMAQMKAHEDAQARAYMGKKAREEQMYYQKQQAAEAAAMGASKQRASADAAHAHMMSQRQEQQFAAKKHAEERALGQHKAARDRADLMSHRQHKAQEAHAYMANQAKEAQAMGLGQPMRAQPMRAGMAQPMMAQSMMAQPMSPGGYGMGGGYGMAHNPMMGNQMMNEW